jgi:hypothetical protein
MAERKSVDFSENNLYFTQAVFSSNESEQFYMHLSRTGGGLSQTKRWARASTALSRFCLVVALVSYRSGNRTDTTPLPPLVLS